MQFFFMNGRIRILSMKCASIVSTGGLVVLGVTEVILQNYFLLKHILMVPGSSSLHKLSLDSLAALIAYLQIFSSFLSIWIVPF